MHMTREGSGKPLCFFLLFVLCVADRASLRAVEICRNDPTVSARLNIMETDTMLGGFRRVWMEVNRLPRVGWSHRFVPGVTHNQRIVAHQKGFQFHLRISSITMTTNNNYQHFKCKDDNEGFIVAVFDWNTSHIKRLMEIKDFKNPGTTDEALTMYYACMYTGTRKPTKSRKITKTRNIIYIHG